MQDLSEELAVFGDKPEVACFKELSSREKTYDVLKKISRIEKKWQWHGTNIETEDGVHVIFEKSRINKDTIKARTAKRLQAHNALC